MDAATFLSENGFQIIKAIIIWYLFFLFLKRVLLHYQNLLLYIPEYPSAEYRYPEQNPAGLQSPKEYGISYEDIVIPQTAKNYCGLWRTSCNLHGWLLKSKDKKAYTMIFFQGNAGNIGDSLLNLEFIYTKLKCNIVVVGYRGYGHSEGKPSEDGLKQDAQSILDWTLSREDIDSKKIIVFGRSLGGAVAIDLCSKRQKDICGLIIENTFTNAFDFSESFIMGAYWLKKILLMIDWPSINSIQSITTPILFISGRKDKIVKYELMDRLHQAAGNSKFKRMFKVEDGEHNDTWIKAGDDYCDEISTFVGKCFNLLS